MGLRAGRGERAGLAALYAIFAYFTIRGMLFFYSGDDMMNMHAAWLLRPSRLARSLIEIWVPVYRPLGAAVYRIFYEAFGFHPLPLYIFCWLLLALNVALGWRFLREILPAPYAALTALSFVLVHGSFQDLYLSAGTLYDRFCFLFTVLGLTLYARIRRSAGPIPWGRAALVVLMCVLAMDSKESGIALVPLMALYELIFVRGKRRLRKIAPLYATLAVICLVFIYLRVHNTPELSMNQAYAPKLRLGLWLTHVAEYMTKLFYGHIPFTAAITGALFVTMAAAALLLRDRAMIFGWLFFVVTITPVALISSRPGYVLYVPDLGLGIWLAALIWRIAGARAPASLFALATALTLWFHAANWPPPFHPEDSPEVRLTEQFRHDYPTMPTGAHLLFVSDDFPRDAYDLLFNLRLMYGDHSLQADRVAGPPNQQPDPAHSVTYDHAFVYESGHYLELDNSNLAESRRLRIIKGYTVGREMNFANQDYTAYLVSGVMGGDPANPERWTEPEARLKFDVYPAPAALSLKFWVPDFVAKSAQRSMQVLVNDQPVADYPLNHDGMNEPSFSVPAAAISKQGFTVVTLRVQNPYHDPDGTARGVILLRAGFSYQP